MTPGFPIALYYFTFLGALGIFWPYFSLYLATVGLTPGEITRVLALTPIMGLVAPPLFGLLADARRARGWLLRVASFATLLSFSGFFFARGARPAIYLTTAAFAFCRAPLLSLSDATAIEHVRRHGGSYGLLRVWGSVGFVLAVIAGGLLLDRLGLPGVLPATSMTLALAAGAAWWMPAPPPERHPEALSAWMGLLQNAELWLFLAAVIFAQMAGAAYDACFSLHLHRLGFSPQFVGAAWAVGVIAEVILMIGSGPLYRRFGAERVFACALWVASLRWLLLAQARHPLAILALQPLHGITFGWFYVAGVTIMRDRGGSEAPTAAQGLFAGALALGSVIGMPLAGRILERSGGIGLFSTSSVVAALGAACAVGYAWRDRRARARVTLERV